MRLRIRDDGAIRPKKMPWIAAAIGAGRWSRVSSRIPVQNGTTPRGTARVTIRSPLIVSGRKREMNSSGANAIMPASRALSSTGISAIDAAHPLGGQGGDLEGHVGPQRGASDDCLFDVQLVQEGDHLLAEGRHRVVQRILGAIRAPVAEEIEGDHVGAASGQVARKRLVHPAWHQLPVEEHDPAVAAAVLGVLQPVAVVEELTDPLRNQGHGGHFGTRGTLRRVGSSNGPDECPHQPPIWATLNGWRGHGSDARRLLLAGALAVAAYGAGVWAIGIASHDEVTAAWWPAAGLGVMAALWLPRHRWPLLFVGLFLAYTLANVTGGRPWLAASLLGLADIAETILVAVLVTRFVGRRMWDVIDVWKLFGIAALGALVAATGIATTSAMLLGGSFWSTLLVTAPSHACSVMLLAPVALTSWLDRRTRIQPLELATQATLLFVLTVVTFGPSQDVTVGFAPLPLLVWAAVRFDVRVVVLEQVLFATAVTLYTRFGWGPFNQGGDAQAPESSTQAASST